MWNKFHKLGRLKVTGQFDRDISIIEQGPLLTDILEGSPLDYLIYSPTSKTLIYIIEVSPLDYLIYTKYCNTGLCNGGLIWQPHIC